MSHFFFCCTFRLSICVFAIVSVYHCFVHYIVAPPSAPVAAPLYAAPPGYPGAMPAYNAPHVMAGAGNWVDASGGQIPPGAVVGGQDCSGEPLYVARAQHEGALIPGKLCASHGCAYVPWGGQEHGKPQYQVCIMNISFKT